MGMTRKKHRTVSQVAATSEAELIEWMTGLQMTNKILLKQLEAAVVNHEDEGAQLAESLIGLSEDETTKTSVQWVSRLAQSMEILQSRDSVNQQLDGVHTVLRQLNEFIEQSTHACKAGEALPSFEGMIRSLYQNYVMAAQRDIHHQITGVKESSENLQKVDLF